ncbi:Peptide hydrolase [Mycena indigotica]|uniref:Peptide hydrolase n=1 Tax=Mycena indigotica TaxID=2126181 RepID=A0A8H6T6T2_9AGAR|nr:Peptide hydrolase [Mycena indigotica]KAF7312128.1 Peptide hydrolase [Mycena indigotica]
MRSHSPIAIWFAFACTTSLAQQTPLDSDSGFQVDFNALRLVQLSEGSNATWMTERQKLAIKAAGWDYADITETPLLGSTPKRHFSCPAPSSPIVANVLPLLSTAEPKANLKHLTSYHTRYYNSDTGAAASDWLYSKILAYTDELASEEQKMLIAVESVQHKWKQNSIVIRIAPLDASNTDATTIVGAHIDSINRESVFHRAPGAGDDGSGTVTILEAYRALLLSGYVPSSPLEFHFYAGEEGGLLGSLALAARFEEKGKEVRGMIQFDMTDFVKTGSREEIAVIGNENQVDAELTEFLIAVIDRYIEIPWVRDFYPKGPSSDHQSWKMAGFQSCHPLEAQFKNTNNYIHGVDDLLDISPEFSSDHMLHFSKLAVAFAIELSSY